MSKAKKQDKLIQLISASTREPFTINLFESQGRIRYDVAVRLHYIMIGKYTTVEDFYRSHIHQSDSLQFFYWGVFTDRDRALFNKFASTEILKHLIG